jgi:hypothetical protein
MLESQVTFAPRFRFTIPSQQRQKTAQEKLPIDRIGNFIPAVIHSCAEAIENNVTKLN